jgi:hypothetical protein
MCPRLPRWQILPPTVFSPGQNIAGAKTQSRRRNARKGRKYAYGTRSFQAAADEGVTILDNIGTSVQ